MKSNQESQGYWKLRNIIPIAFAISGFTALVYEVVWTRPLQLIFGSTVYAFSTILTSFFIGFALGALLIRNFADRTKSPAKVFAMLQLGIGLYGLIMLWLLSILAPIYLALDAAEFNIIKFFPLFLVIIIPATLFGATWPVANKAYIGEGRHGKLGKDIGLLYSANSLGSFAGPLAAGFVMMPLLGIKTSAILAASLNIVAAIALFVFVVFDQSSEKNKGGEEKR